MKNYEHHCATGREERGGTAGGLFHSGAWGETRVEGTPRMGRKPPEAQGGQMKCRTSNNVSVPERPQCLMRCAYTKKVFIVYLKFRFHCVFCRYLLSQTTLY